MIGWLLGGDEVIGQQVQPWDAVRADRQAAVTEKMLLGAVVRGPQVELSAAQRARKRGLRERGRE
jgi:hypothetical protein